MRTILMSVVVAVAAFLSLSASAEPHKDQWMVGFWHMTKDEDGGPTGSEVEFRADGSYVAYDKTCKTYPNTTYFVHNGDIFVVYTIPGKGPVSVVYHPDNAHTQLTFTSVRTRNNAVYERAATHHCGAQG